MKNIYTYLSVSVISLLLAVACSLMIVSREPSKYGQVLSMPALGRGTVPNALIAGRRASRFILISERQTFGITPGLLVVICSPTANALYSTAA